MKKALLRHLILGSPSLSNPNFFLIKPISSSSSSATETSHNLILEEEQQQQQLRISKANLLIPRLCESNNLRDAIRLIDALLLTNPPLDSLSLSVLIDRISDEPDMSHSMALLNRLNHQNPTAHTALQHITRMLINSYFKKRKIKEAMKVFRWMLKKKTRLAEEVELYEVVVRELCRKYEVLEALRVVKAMVEAEMVPGSETRRWLLRGLLREARISEAQEMNEALGCDCVEKMGELLDQIIRNWKD